MSSLCAKLAAWTLVAVLLQIVGISLFVFGFFPVKPALSGVSGPESYQMPTCNFTGDYEDKTLPPDQLKTLYKELSKIPPAFDRLILMVVDGLPAEFVLGKADMPLSNAMMETMPYTQSLLSSGRAIGYHAKAAPPTVTMPRLKAIISGAIGSFLDVAFNFNTQALLDDNLLDQFHRIGWEIVIHGDDTWVKLFPGLFLRQDGVNSFYVKDTVEVDLNVSRHLGAELAANDWNLLILHYLGLDHVGHIGGRNSLLMGPKLKEMDEVIKMIDMDAVLKQINLGKRTLLSLVPRIYLLLIAISFFFKPKMVVSDHGMSASGNHGGSSYEETDSLALFVGPEAIVPDPRSGNRYAVSQVDIAPTVALLFGVPIPKNNVGVLLMEMFNFLTDEQRMRALELNSWQLLRLLQAQLPGLLCGNSLCNGCSDKTSLITREFIDNIEQKLCQLYIKATASFYSWKISEDSATIHSNIDHLNGTIEAYYDFLRTASEWLSRRATDKPIDLLASGIAIMLVSCAVLLSLLFFLFKDVFRVQNQWLPDYKFCYSSWNLDEAFVLLGALIHVFSLGASSMVEEEQYMWHFLTTTLYFIFLFMEIRSLVGGHLLNQINVVNEDEKHIFQRSRRTDVRFINYFRICCVLTVLTCARILRGWHQGGVNWTHLPDISKWLEQAGSYTVKYFQVASLFLAISLGSFTLLLARSRGNLITVVLMSHFVSGLLVLTYVLGYQTLNVMACNHSYVSVAQIIFIALGINVIIVLASPWLTPVCYREIYRATKLQSEASDMKDGSLLVGIQDSMYLIGVACSASWCLLQLLLQKPINAMPVLMIFLQILATVAYFSTHGSNHRQWVEVAAMYFLGMAGHFGLGNSNSIATVDVAGAFTGTSSYSTVLSGILMFIITYASPLLVFLGMVIYISMKDIKPISDPQKPDLSCILQMMIGFPCLVPLVFNSVTLTAFTIILLLMRNHLFVWSVFSPKCKWFMYLYICAATVSVYTGVFIISTSGVYTCAVLCYRAKKLSSKIKVPS